MASRGTSESVLTGYAGGSDSSDGQNLPPALNRGCKGHSHVLALERQVSGCDARFAVLCQDRGLVESTG